MGQLGQIIKTLGPYARTGNTIIVRVRRMSGVNSARLWGVVNSIAVIAAIIVIVVVVVVGDGSAVVVSRGVHWSFVRKRSY